MENCSISKERHKNEMCMVGNKITFTCSVKIVRDELIF